MPDCYAERYNKMIDKNQRLREESLRDYEVWKEMKERKIQQLEEARKELKDD